MGFMPGFIPALSGVIICHLHIVFPVPQDPSDIGSVLELKSKNVGILCSDAVEFAYHVLLTER